MVSKTVIGALERVFAAEINGELPFQSKARIFQRLYDDGLVQPMEQTVGGHVPISVKGWQLTHAGRFLYCSSCDPEESYAAN